MIAIRNKINAVLPEWAGTIKAVRGKLKLSQSELAQRLETSAMAISRWERGEFEPSADAYLRLGKLMGDPLCWFFWGRAGLSTADVMRVLPKASRRLREDRIPTVQIVHACSCWVALAQRSHRINWLTLKPVRTNVGCALAAVISGKPNGGSTHPGDNAGRKTQGPDLMYPAAPKPLRIDPRRFMSELLHVLNIRPRINRGIAVRAALAAQFQHT